MARMFHDRTEAGEALAEAVAQLDLTDPVVLALPRGGIPVALPVARRLNAPLDLLMVRKLGMPGQPELAAGAVVNGAAPQTVFNRELLSISGLTEADFDADIREKLTEIASRRAKYLGGRAPAPVAGRSAIVVDDGIATGATMKAALLGLRGAKPAQIVLAVPVAPDDTLSEMTPLVDQVVCLATPQPYYAVGAHYDRFDQVADDEVVRMLAEADREYRENAE